LTIGGYTEEATAWRNWLLRAAAGDPASLQTMYGVAGERRLTELELEWLPGFADSKPVRIGNAAVHQFQLDVYGELIDALHLGRRGGIAVDKAAWAFERALMAFLDHAWTEPDEGIWEVRGPRRHFTHSKVMAWVAFDRAVKAVERYGLEGPADRWRARRDQIHAEVCERGFDRDRGTFTQFYGSRELDASALMFPLVGFLPATDPRIVGTVQAIEHELKADGFILRYQTSESGHVDGLPAGEGLFLPCTFWLADNYVLQGHPDRAEELFERLVAIANDVGLFSEEFDPRTGRFLGNFPQALTHVSLINTAQNLG